MRKYVAGLLIFAQMVTVTPAWGMPPLEGLETDALLSKGSSVRQDPRQGSELSSSGQASINGLEPSIQSPEQKIPCLRWADLNHFLESLLAFPLIGHTDINPKALLNRRHYIKGHGLWMVDQAPIRRLYATNGFRQGFEFLLHRGVHLALLGFTAAQFATATSFVDFFDKFWNGDEYAITALAYATSRTEALNGLYALLALPAFWGGVKAILFARSAQANPSPGFERALKTVQDAGFPSTRPWWKDGIRWVLPLHPLDRDLNALVRALRWDGRLTPDQRERGFQALKLLFRLRGIYTKIVAAFHLAQLADSPHVSELALLKSYDERTVAQLLKMKGDSLEEIQRLGKFPTTQWQRASFKEKIELLAHFIYGRYLQWWLGLAPTRKESAAFWGFKVAKTLASLTIIKTVVQALMNFASCPKRQGVSFTGTASWSSDYSETCYNAYWNLFNLIPGQPASTLTNILGNFYLPNFGDVLDLSGKGLNGTQVAELMQGFATYQPQLVFRALNLSGNALTTPGDFNAFIPVFSLPYYSQNLQTLDLSNNDIEALSSDGTVALAHALPYLPNLAYLNISRNKMGYQGTEGTAALGQAFQSLPSLIYLDLAYNWIGYLGTAGIEALAQGLCSLRNFTFLNLSQNKIGSWAMKGDKIASLAQLTNLISLDLSGNEIGFRGINETVALANSLPSLSHLTSLDLSQNDMGPTIGSLANALPSLAQLMSLDVSDNWIDSLELQELTSALIRLSHLSALYVLQQAPFPQDQLSELRMFWDHRSSHTDLYEILNPSDVSVYFATLPSTTQSISLRGLLNNPDFFTMTALMQGLLTFSELRTLDLSNIALGMEGIYILAQGLPSLSHLTSLDFAENDIGSNIEFLANALSSLTRLVSLDLAGNNIAVVSTEGLVALANALPALTNLTFLDMSGNDIDGSGTEGTVALAQALSSLPHLTVLNLAENYIDRFDTNGTKALANALRVLPNLTVLNLAENYIGWVGLEGTVALANALPALTNLRALDVSENWIGWTGSEGTMIFAQGLLDLTNLKTLNLGGNKIGWTGSEGPTAVLAVLPHLTTLQTIDISGMQHVSWTDAANALASFNDQKLRAACQNELCFGTSINGTHRESSWMQDLEIPSREEGLSENTPLERAMLKISEASLTGPWRAFTYGVSFLKGARQNLPVDLPKMPPREPLRIKTSHALSSEEGETGTAFSSPRFPSYPPHTAVSGGVGFLLLGKGFYDAGRALAQVGRNLWALAVHRYTGQTPEGFLLSGNVRDRKLSKVNALFTSLLEKSRTERYQDTVWAWWLEDHQDEWEKLQRIIPLFRKALKTFKRKLKQFAQDWDVFEESQQATSSQRGSA